MILKDISHCFLVAGLVAGWFFGAGAAIAAPEVQQLTLPQSGGVTQGALIEVSGNGFGQKANAAPILFDHAHHAYEYGKLNDVHSTLGNMDPFPVAREGSESALWTTRTSTALFASDTPKRHPYSKGSYFLKGENGWFGLPVAYGGQTGWETPTDNSQIYISWWYKNKYHSTNYWRFSAHEQVGSFIPDETLSITGGGTGVYAGIDKDGLHNAVLHKGSVGLAGAVIKGNQSGATAVFPDHFRGGSGTGYETPGSKLARVWDDPSGHGTQGIRSSVALHDFYVSTSKAYQQAKVYNKLKLPANKWVHIEYELDTDLGVVRLYEDGRFGGEDFFDPDAIYKGRYSPTLSLIGTNAKQLKLQESEISEIYVDSSFQRVVIGNAPHYKDVTHRELQQPISWSDNNIEFKLHLGSLDISKTLYLYVLDRNSDANEQGVAICLKSECNAPPKPIALKVE